MVTFKLDERLVCKDCGEVAKTYYSPEFYDVDEGGWVTDCGTGGCGFEVAKTRKESRENFKANRAERAAEGEL